MNEVKVGNREVSPEAHGGRHIRACRAMGKNNSRYLEHYIQMIMDVNKV